MFSASFGVQQCSVLAHGKEGLTAPRWPWVTPQHRAISSGPPALGARPARCPGARYGAAGGAQLCSGAELKGGHAPIALLCAVGGLLVGFPEDIPESLILHGAELQYYIERFQRSGFR